ncbi:hypothetical protein AALM99_10395, partial [Lactococcus muris]
IQNGVMYDDGQNPLPNEDSAPADFDFSTMRPGRIFTMAGEQYRYLENMGSGNHMIIREGVFAASFNNQDERHDEWYDTLEPVVQAMVQPVSNSFETGAIPTSGVSWPGGIGNWRWIPTNLYEFPEAEDDVTRVDASGTPRAFALSFADVVRLSGPGRAFPNIWRRLGTGGTEWWTRTPADANMGWSLLNRNGEGRLEGGLFGHHLEGTNQGGRPAIIINQST